MKGMNCLKTSILKWNLDFCIFLYLFVYLFCKILYINQSNANVVSKVEAVHDQDILKFESYRVGWISWPLYCTLHSLKWI